MNSQQVAPISLAEWEELASLKAAIDGYPQSVCPSRQERFTELMVKSLVGKGDRPLIAPNCP